MTEKKNGLPKERWRGGGGPAMLLYQANETRATPIQSAWKPTRPRDRVERV
jgi:hypothetical protein